MTTTDSSSSSSSSPSFVDNDTTSSSSSAGEAQCLDDRYWFYFLASSLLVFFAGLVIILTAKLCLVLIYLYYKPGCCSRRRRRGRKDSIPRRRSSIADAAEDEGVAAAGGGGGGGDGDGVSIVDGDGEQHRFSLCSPMIVSYNRVKGQCQGLISGHSLIGRILVSTSCILSLGSLGIYLYNASIPGAQVETCFKWGDSITQQIDFAFNMFFLLYFFIRFLAADDKFFFWIEINSFVDYFTIPPVFVGISINRQWLGLRFLRAFRLMNIPDILQYLRILKTGNLIRLAQLLCIFASVWLASAGFIHLLELSGDPFEDFSNAQEITYWESVYFVVVTMATVGYGDIYCHTTLGRAFMVFFIFGALAMFASFIPEIADLIRKRQNAYGGYYEKPIGVNHVVVTGHVTYESVKHFVRDFFHEDRDTKNVKAVFIDSRHPELKLEALFKRHVTRLVFIKGSVMSIQDLNKVRLHEAEACLIMSNPTSSDADSEDAANIMRVISVKNYDPNVTVIVQLMHYRNKALCVNQPSWTSRDQVICLSEMKLGFIASGCLAPGFSTLIANLFIMVSYKQNTTQGRAWIDDYLHGTGMEVYCETFSPAFHGQTFTEAAKICYKQLQLLLVAVTREQQGSFNEVIVILNPGTDFVINARTKGFFICQSEEESKRIQFFCPHHNDKILNGSSSQMRHCSCHSQTHSRDGMGSIAASTLRKRRWTGDNWNGGRGGGGEDDLQQISLKTIDRHLASLTANNSLGDEKEGTSHEETMRTYSLDNEYVDLDLSKVTPDITEDTEGGVASIVPLTTRSPTSEGKKKQMERFDSTGLFHWCPDRNFDDCTLANGRNGDVIRGLNSHVVLCCFAGGASSESEGVDERAEGASIGLCNFVMPLRASNLRTEELRSIVIIGDRKFLRKEWPTIRNFPEVYLKLGSALNRSELRLVRIQRCQMCVVLTNNESKTEDATLIDKESILCTLNIKTMKFNAFANDIIEVFTSSGVLSQAYETFSGSCIPILTELANDLNVQFLDQDDDDDPGIPLYMTQPYASGRAFVASVLDTLMITTYFNPESLSLIRNFITGGDTKRLEYILAEGSGLIGGQHRPDTSGDPESMRDRCRAALLPLNRGILAESLNAENYGSLLLHSLDKHGLLCLGLYRLIPSKRNVSVPNEAGYRFVITNPPHDFKLQPLDKVYCLEPFDKSHRPIAETQL